jgi:hypothetical protein
MKKVTCALAALFLAFCCLPAFTGEVSKGFTNSSGVRAVVDFPYEWRLENKAGIDGAGLCVFTSTEMAARWHGWALKGFRDWMTKKPGGGYPSKLDKMIQEFCKIYNVEVVDYWHYEGRDLSILEEALKHRCMLCVTYSWSPTGRYGGRKIAHMVNLVHASGNDFCILDNNYPDSYEWMTRKEFEKSWTGYGNGWAVIINTSPLPPSVVKP